MNTGMEAKDNGFCERQIGGFNRASLEAALDPSFYTPHGLINFFAKKYGDEFEADVGLREGYTLGTHTEMVLTQYEKYFDGDHFLRVVIALHDIGKPEATRQGNKWIQHQYTGPMVDTALEELGYTEAERKHAVALVTHDIIGGTIKGVRRGDPDALETNAQKLLQTATKADASPEEFFRQSIIIFKADASSYTEDAGGGFQYTSDKPSLAFLFNFEGEQSELNFAPGIDVIVSRLKDKTAELTMGSPKGM